VGLATMIGAAIVGAALLALALGWLETSVWGPLGMSALFALGLALASRRKIATWLASVRARYAPVAPIAAASPVAGASSSEGASPAIAAPEPTSARPMDPPME
jgi:hypothetical protein